MLSVGEMVAFYALSSALLVRALHRRTLSRLPLFYTYLAYMLVSGLLAVPMYAVKSPFYPQAVWARLLTGLVAEFIVLLEISDQLFNRFAAIRRLGRLLIGVITVTFFFLYVLPALMEPQTSRSLIFEFFKRASLTKAAIILALLAACRFYRLPLGRDVSGILVGFMTFLTVNIVNTSVAERFSPAVYERTFGIIGPISYTLGMLIWTIALWNAAPVPAARAARMDERPAMDMGLRLEKLNTALGRLRRQ